MTHVNILRVALLTQGQQCPKFFTRQSSVFFGAAMDPWTEHRPFGRRVDVGAHSRNAQAVERRRCARAGGLRPFAKHRVQPELVCLTLSRAATRRIAARISTRQDEAEVKRIIIEHTERGYPSHCTLTRSLMCQSSSSHHPR